MRLRTCLVAACLSAMSSIPCLATVFSSLHGVVHDEQHFPVKGAEVAVRAAGSSFEMQATTNADGEFELNSLPLGDYRVHVEANGFAVLQIRGLARIVFGKIGHGRWRPVFLRFLAADGVFGDVRLPLLRFTTTGSGSALVEAPLPLLLAADLPSYPGAKT